MLLLRRWRVCDECFDLVPEIYAIGQRVARADSGDTCCESIAEGIAERKPAPVLHFGGYVSERLSKDSRPAAADQPACQKRHGLAFRAPEAAVLVFQDGNHASQVYRAARIIRALFLLDIDFLDEFTPGPHVSCKFGMTDVGSLMIDIAAGEYCCLVVVGRKGRDDDFAAVGVGLIPLDPQGHSHFCAEGLQCNPQASDDGGYFRGHDFSLP